MQTKQSKTTQSSEDTINPTRSALLAAARKLIADQGDVEFSLSQLAKVSGKNSALVSYHFGGKEQLLLAVLDDSADDLMLPLQHLAARDIPADEKLRLHLTGVIKVHARNKHLNILTRTLLRRSSDNAAKKIADQFVKPIIDFQDTVLKQGVKEGIFRKVDTFSFYIAALGAIDMFFAGKATIKYGFGRSRSSADRVEKFANEVSELLIRGIRK